MAFLAQLRVLGTIKNRQPVTVKTVMLLMVMAAYFGSIIAHAQMPNRYPKLDDFGHQIYLEQHELPFLANGPTDPAPSPDGTSIAFAAKGWIWLMDLNTKIAKRLTNSPHVDSRPRWSPDGSQLAFVRDTSTDTSLIVLTLDNGVEQEINTPAMDLDPEFSADGASLYFASGASGSINVWQHHLATGHQQMITDGRQVERNIRRVSGGKRILYMHGVGAIRSLRLRDFISGEDSILYGDTLTYHLTADVHKSLPLITYSAPTNGNYHLYTMDMNDPRVRHRLTDGTRYALSPAFSADGEYIYFTEADDKRQFHLKRIKTYGGDSEVIEIAQWDYGTDSGEVSLTLQDENGQATTARVSIVSSDGHPVAGTQDATYFDPQTGRAYFYVAGNETITLPKGRYDIEVTKGFFRLKEKQRFTIRGDRATEVNIALNSIWDARSAGFVSVDYHNHLNGDGTSRAMPQHSLRLQAGEELDQVGNMTWNRWERRIDGEILGDLAQEGNYIASQGQEVRSHYHGHIGLNNISDAYEPWFWGPRNPVLGNPDLANAEVIEYAKTIDAFPTFVHPGVRAPEGPDDNIFAEPERLGVSVDFINEMVLDTDIGLEIITGWDGPLGGAELWYRLLNIGQPIIGMTGTDAWGDFYRTPAYGTTRYYVPIIDGKDDFVSTLKTAREGRGFISTGPALLFTVDSDKRPGDVVNAGSQNWSLTITSLAALDKVEIIVNGQIVETLDPIKAGESKTYTGTVTLPAGGWIAARTYSSQETQDPWPAMHRTAFAHSQPLWIGEKGSINESARSAAAKDLISAINHAEQRARAAYGDTPMTKLYTRYQQAREKLEGYQ